jgi:hypothetical protein
MARLTHRAFDILQAEVKKCAAAEIGGAQVQRQIVMKRLEKLRLQEGTFATAEELREIVKDLFPNFSEKAIKAAAKANCPPGILSKITFVSTLIVGATGLIWVINLPFPMIRWPVAKTAPILLLPSYISMDHNYRQAIAKVEQADQLINKATASADFDLGEIKAQEAQKHLDALPVWFLGYYPQAYCTFFGCTWRFTFDEFEAARKNIGRMEAQIFQQKNALTQLNQTELALNTAKQQYQQAKTAPERQQASAAWQTAIDQLGQIPNETLAGEMAHKKLQTASRDFDQVGGVATGSQLTDNLIEAAKEFAMSAAVSSQNPPHPAEKWEQIANLWQESIQRLEQVRADNPGYLQAQGKLAEYKRNLGNAQLREKIERDSANALESAKNAIANWQKLALAESPDRAYLVGQLREIINNLEAVKTGTTSYSESRKLLNFANKKQQELLR